MGRKQKAKPKKSKVTKPRKTATKTVKTVVKANTTSKEFQRCKEWLIAQRQQVNKYMDNGHDTLTDAESNFDNDQTESATVQDDVSSLSKIIYKIYFACEWGKCNDKQEEFVPFEQHVVSHITETIEENPTTGYRCQWDLCCFKNLDLTAFRIHVYYHTYHTKLKTIGESMLTRRKIPPCSIDSRRRNFIPENLVQFTCQWDSCNCKYEKIYDYFEHVRKHCSFENAMEQKYLRNHVRQLNCGWVGCTKQFSRIGPFTNHIRIHTQEKLFACPNCGSSFMSYCKFYTHFIRQSGEKPFQCAQCLKNFATEELLCSHMYAHVNCYKCTMCDMTCPSPSALAKHVRYRHLPEKPFQCTDCSFQAVYKYDLDKHIIAKHERPIHECEEFGCGFTTYSFNLMRKHDRDVHGLGPFIYCCHCCPIRFSEGRRLSRHLIRKHNFQLPSGHTRFIYRQQMDGLFRLQTMRMESLEVTQQLMLPPANEATDKQPNKNNFFIAEMKETEKFVSIVLDVMVERSHVDDDNTSESTHYFNEMPRMDDTSNENSLVSEIEIGPESKDGIVILASNDDNNANNEMTDGIREISLKSIDNFSVMKRYIKEKKSNIIIEMKELDESGNVVNSELVKADEFCVAKAMK